MIALALLQVAALAAQPEANYYAVDYLVQPEGQRIEVGGIDFLPDGRLICSTRRGQVWIVDNPLAKDPKDANKVRSGGYTAIEEYINSLAKP